MPLHGRFFPFYTPGAVGRNRKVCTAKLDRKGGEELCKQAYCAGKYWREA